MLLLVASTTYPLGLFLGGLVLRAMSTRNVVGNVVVATMMAICGVNVPLSFFPAPPSPSRADSPPSSSLASNEPMPATTSPTLCSLGAAF